MKNIKQKIFFNCGLLILILIFSIFISCLIGASKISPHKIIFLLKNKLILSKDLPTTPEETILFQIRLPRILLAGLVGASLGMAGVAFQGILRNPLADPYIIGTSSGAALGATLSMVLKIPANFKGIPLTPLFAFLGAILSLFIIYQLSRRENKIPVETFLLVGVVLGTFLWALVSFLLILSKENLPKIIFWMMGGFFPDWSYLGMILPYLIIGSIILFMHSYSLNLLTLGEEQAEHLGIDVEKTKIQIILSAALITAASVSVSGLIGFIGLMIPHILRIIQGADHRLLFPASALTGAIFLIWTDNLARTLIAPAEIPVGIITALLGAPFFFYLFKRKNFYK